MEPIKWAVLMVGLILFLLVYSVYSQRKVEAELKMRLHSEWGRPGERKNSHEAFEQISHFYQTYSEGCNVVDDITWNDLDMDRVFKAVNTTNSSVGQECLYRIMRVLEDDRKVLVKRHENAEYFREHQEERLELQHLFARTGYCRNISYFDYIWLLSQVKTGGVIKHWLAFLATVASLVFMLCVDASVGVLLFIGCIIYDVGSYYKSLADVKPYFSCIKIISRMLVTAKKLINMRILVLGEECRALEEYIKEFEFIHRDAMFISSSGSIDGSVASLVMDYLKMFTHIDLIKFKSIARKVSPLVDDLINFSKTMGDIEAGIAIASFRECLQQWCEPVLSRSDLAELKTVDVYHPLIEEPVANSIDADRGVLITGSNASGKSTFIKTIAINTILAQTIYTACAKEFAVNYCRVYSSMALTDDLENNESYYMVEIRSLKRILDASKEDNLPLICMVDEVLRGTNTIERIAASSQILKSLARPEVLCFAATHDIELTHILEEDYDNYHFKEDVQEDDVKFDYQLLKGPATTRNAIKLLKIMGYDSDIVNKADEMALALLKA